MTRAAMAGMLMVVLVTAVGCGDDAGGTSTTVPETATVSSVDQPTTTLLKDLSLPSAVEIESLAWEGTLFVDSYDEETGRRSRADGTVRGTYVAPASHTILLRVDLEEADPEQDSRQTETLAWDATVIGDAVWYSEDGAEPLVGSIAEGDAEDAIGILSTAGGAVLPTEELLDDLGDREWEHVEVAGTAAMGFSISGVALSDFGGLFGAALVGDSPPPIETVDVTMSIDPVTGVVLEGRLEGEGRDDGAVTEIMISFGVTEIDGADVEIFPPGVEPFDVPEGLLPFVDEDGRFRLAVPPGWEVDAAAETVAFVSDEGYTRFGSVLIEQLDEETTTADYVESLIAESDESVNILEQSSVEHSAMVWERVDARFEADGVAVHGVAWVTVVGRTAVGFQYTAPLDTWDDDEQVAEAMFESFGLLELTP